MTLKIFLVGASQDETIGLPGDLVLCIFGNVSLSSTPLSDIPIRDLVISSKNCSVDPVEVFYKTGINKMLHNPNEVVIS